MEIKRKFQDIDRVVEIIPYISGNCKIIINDLDFIVLQEDVDDFKKLIYEIKNLKQDNISFEVYNIFHPTKEQLSYEDSWEMYRLDIFVSENELYFSLMMKNRFWISDTTISKQYCIDCLIHLLENISDIGKDRIPRALREGRGCGSGGTVRRTNI